MRLRSAPSGWRYASVLDTNVVGIGSGSNGVRQNVSPVNDSGPSVVPWYASLRAIALRALALAA